MSLRTCEKPSDDGFEKAYFEAEFLNIPAVAYFSQKAFDYYLPPSIPPSEFAPVAVPFEMTLKGSFDQGLQGAFEFLLVGGTGNTDQALMRIYGSSKGYKLFNGRVFFFRHVKNFEPPFPQERVDRIGILGVTQSFQFGFFRQIDSLGAGFPDLEEGPLDFQLFASPAACLNEQREVSRREGFCGEDFGDETLLGSMFYKELMIEAGSPSALAGNLPKAGNGKGSKHFLF